MSPTPAPSTGIAVDGEWGKATTTALQKALGTVQDGIVSGQRVRYKRYWTACLSTSWKWGIAGRSDVITAMQRRIGIGADGVAGPATAKALQKHLGVTVDGIVGQKTVKALQKRLNAGTF